MPEQPVNPSGEPDGDKRAYHPQQGGEGLLGIRIAVEVGLSRCVRSNRQRTDHFSLILRLSSPFSEASIDDSSFSDQPARVDGKPFRVKTGDGTKNTPIVIINLARFSSSPEPADRIDDGNSQGVGASQLCSTESVWSCDGSRAVGSWSPFAWAQGARRVARPSRSPRSAEHRLRRSEPQ